MRRVAILGGGISGLAAAFSLHEARAAGVDVEFTVFEASERAGGCIETLQTQGFTMELGADSLLADKPAARELLRRLQLESELVGTPPQYRGARILHRGRLRPIPGDFQLFAPTSLAALLTSGIFSARGIARAALEPFIPPRSSDDDESLASFVTRRFGREVLDRLAQPLIGGIYSGDPQRLSMQATLPQFVEMEGRHGSVLRAMAADRSHAGRRNGSRAQLMSLRGGLQTLVEALVQRLGSAVKTRAEVTGLQRDAQGWTLHFADGASARADAVVCALPAYTAAQLLPAIDSELAQMLEQIRYNSITTVNLAYDAAELPSLPPATGFVVPAIEQRRITAATIATQKYPQRAPAERVLLRAFIGGALQPELLAFSDEEPERIARAELRVLLHVSAQPQMAVVRRWDRLLPEYAVGHLRLVDTLERRAAALGGLALAGSAYRGVGIPDCIAGGQAAAGKLLSAWEPAKGG